MKLIRKDYAQDIVINESKKHSGFEFCFKPVYDRITDCVEVEAIPIEWLKKNVDIYYDLGLDTIAKELNYLIFEWEKENE